MAVEWEEMPLDKETLRPGQSWTYRLPLRLQGAAPAVQWNCDLLPPSAIEVDGGDPLRLTVSVPPEAHAGFGEITYHIQDADGPVRGRILIRVQCPSSTGPARVKCGGPKPPSPQVSSGGALPAAPLDTSAPASTATSLSNPVDANSAPGAAAAGGLDATADTSPSLHGVFRVDVIRNGVCVPGLRTVLHPGRAISIGKSSATEGIPDLDLRGQFETPDLEAACSRQQAEVFWSEQRIWVKTLGKYPLKFLEADGNPGQDVPALHCWQPGQVLALPGKLRLALRRDRS